MPRRAAPRRLASSTEGRGWRRLLDVVVPTLQRLPRSLLPRYRVRRVVLVKDLTVSGQYRLAMPAPERDPVLRLTTAPACATQAWR